MLLNMQAECRHKKIIFILPFLLLFFCGLKDYTYSALCFFFLSLHVLNFKFESCSISHIQCSIFYIKPQKISVVKCNDIAFNSCAVLLSFFCNWWNGGRHLIEFKQDQYFSRMATNRSTFNFIQYSTSWYILIVY